MAREELLARTFIELADTLVDDYDIIEVSQRLMQRCVELLDATAAGLLISDANGQLRVMASSSEQLRTVELFEIQASEGPCLECYLTGVPVVNVDLDQHAAQWPRFAPVALGAGYRSVHALPVRLRQHVVGALNLFRETQGALDPLDVVVAQALADATAIAIIQQRTLMDSQMLSAQLTTALESRVVIEQAKGMVAERVGLSLPDAFESLRSYARTRNRQLTGICRDVVEGRINPSDVRGSPGNR